MAPSWEMERDRGLQVGVLVEPTTAWQALMQAGEVEKLEETEAVLAGDDGGRAAVR